MGPRSGASPASFATTPRSRGSTRPAATFAVSKGAPVEMVTVRLWSTTYRSARVTASIVRS